MLPGNTTIWLLLFLLNQVCAGQRLAFAWFIEIAFVIVKCNKTILSISVTLLTKYIVKETNLTRLR